VDLGDKEVAAYHAAGFLTDGEARIRRCPYCIGKRRRVDQRRELPRRIDAGYPYGVISALPGNYFVETTWIEPRERPGPRPGTDPVSDLPALTQHEAKSVERVIACLAKVLTRWQDEGEVALGGFRAPSYCFASAPFSIGIECLMQGLDGKSTCAAFDTWLAKKKPMAYLLAASLVCRSAFAAAADGSWGYRG